MKTPIPAWFILSSAAGLATFAAQSTKDSSREIIGRLSAEPDVVLEWNAAISDHFDDFSHAGKPHVQARVYAMVHLAMRDAIATTRKEAPRDAADGSANFAASAAAYDVLVALLPAGANRFAALQARQVAANANDAAASRSRQIGQRTAASVLRSRANDGWPVTPSAPNGGKAAIDSLRESATKPTPFFLKRVQQFEPEPPYFAYSNGAVLPNDRLQSKKFIGSPGDFAVDERVAEIWGTAPVVRWNRVAHSLAVQQLRDLPARARLLALLNAALADALLAATYWSEVYHHGHQQPPIEVSGALDGLYLAAEAGYAPHPVGPWWVNTRWSGFPAIPAALAGAAEAVLRACFGGDAVFALPAKASDGGARTDFTTLRSAARQCAWAAHAEGASTPEACVAGYDLGSRIAGQVLKQDRR